MILAIQSGDRDKDPYQTRRHMERLLRDHTVPGASVVHVDQPTTMMDQVYTVCSNLDLNVTTVTADFMLHGSGAVGYAMERAIMDADKVLILSGSEDLSLVDREFLSYSEFFGKECVKEVVPYERIVVQ